MTKLHSTTQREFEKFLLFIGCKYVRQKGSHKVFTREGLIRPIILSIHNGAVPAFIIKNNLRLLNITNETYLDILQRL